MRGLEQIVTRFLRGGRLVSVEPFGSGHIHDTYVSRVEGPQGVSRLVHQRINHHVFADPAQVMENIARVTGHLRARIRAEGEDPARRTLTVVPTDEGGDFLRTGDGHFWRTFLYIEGARSHDTARGPEHAYQVARAFALFQHRLADLPPPRLHEVIPQFGNTRKRFEGLLAMLDADPLNRAGGAKPEIAFALERESLASLLVDLRAQDRVPERVVHHDTKINNVLIDDATGEGICVIDLDTVMPGTALYDFGDGVRFGCTRAAEDETDLDKVKLDLDLFEPFARGYLEVACEFLTPVEFDHLVPASRAFAHVLGARFLSDHLAGDRYFKIHREGHNLDRCRTQFAMVREIEAKAEHMQAIVDGYR
jgi:Ser/Thr protein kinase RdoA (MazF antagonist)